MKIVPLYTHFQGKRRTDIPVDLTGLDYLHPYIPGTSAHKLAHYDITFVTGGGGFLTVGKRTQRLAAGDVAFTRPGETRFWGKDRPEGSALLFEGDFAGALFNEEGYADRQPFFKPGRLTAKLHLEEASFAQACSLLGNLSRLLDGTPERAALRACLGDLFALLKEAYTTGPEPEEARAAEGTQAYPYVDEFLRMAAADFRRQHATPYYAEHLGITSDYLNEQMKAVVGLSSKQYLLNRLFLEACRLLKGGTTSVADIADHLHFESLSYFVRFFRNQSGLSPREYRES
ncbi:MAG: helix-turn-helix transcriptional regulator [Tannerella sp.]|jgi:AraC-like DNA-binding protein|nr:helix-turn-helix transcriptional regulator [Tannerella sp.]